MRANTSSFSLRSSRLLFRWLIVGEWGAQPIRTLLAVVAIAIGVALGFAVHLINAAALDAFASGIQRVRGAADLEIRATSDAGFDEALYARLMRAGTQGDPAFSSIATSIAASIAAASPVVEAEVAIAGSRDTLVVTGIDALRAARITPQLIGRPAPDGGSTAQSANEAADATDDARAKALFDPDSIFVSPSTLAALGKKIGDPLAVIVAGRPVVLRIAGSLADDEAAAAPARSSSPARTTRVSHTATMDIAGAQWWLGKLGRLSRIDIALRDGVDATRFAATLAARLPADAIIATPADDRARSGDLSRAYRVNLDMLALMALFTGAFLVYSTQSLSVARRRAQLALLRVVGVTRGGVIAQVIGEGATLGLFGGVLGLALGYALAAAALTWFGGDLGGGYFRATTASPGFLIAAAPGAALVFFALGLAAAVVGSFIPARDAVREAPALALKSSGESDASSAPSVRASAILFTIGAVAAFLPPIASLPLFGYVSIALLLFGGIAAMPWLARVLLGALAHRNLVVAVPLDLAIRRLWGAPSQAAVALCGVVASASLMVAMTVMIASFRHSVDSWLLAVLPADLYLRAGGPAGGFGPNEEALLARVGGVARINFLKSVALQLAPNRPSVALIAREIDAGATRLPLVAGSTEARDGDDAIPIWVSEAMVDLYGFEVGKEVALPIGVVGTSAVRDDFTPSPALPLKRGGNEVRSDAAPKFRVLGVWRDYARQFGAIVIRRTDYTRLTGDARFSDAAITLGPGYAPAAVGASLRAALPPSLAARVELAEPATIRAMSLAIFDRSFAITYLLQAVAIGIGLAGVAATFSAQTLARSREFGMLRHVGVLRRQIVLQLAAEGALLGALGVVAGGSLGLAMSQVLIHVVNPQSFHWTMDTSVPWALLAAVGVALLVASAGAAVLAGRRALSQDAVRAVREDW